MGRTLNIPLPLFHSYREVSNKKIRHILPPRVKSRVSIEILQIWRGPLLSQFLVQFPIFKGIVFLQNVLV